MQNPNSHGYWVLGLAMSVDLQDIPAVQSRCICVKTLAMSTLIEGSEVVVWIEDGQMRREVQSQGCPALPCLVGPWEGGRRGSERMRAEAERRQSTRFRIRKERPANLPWLQLRRGRSEVSSGLRYVR